MEEHDDMLDHLRAYIIKMIQIIRAKRIIQGDPTKEVRLIELSRKCMKLINDLKKQKQT